MNYIHDFAEPPIKDNGYETLRKGTSKYSHVNARVTVKHNCFYRCNGEVECILTNLLKTLVGTIHSANAMGS